MGSFRTRAILKEKGVVFDESSAVVRVKKKRYLGLSAPRSSGGRYVAMGDAAFGMQHVGAKHLETIFPVQAGVLVDVESAVRVVVEVVKRVYEVPELKPKFLRPWVMLGVGAFLNDLEVRSIRRAVLEAGVETVVAVPNLIAASLELGDGLGWERPVVIMDVGWHKSEVAIVYKGGIVASNWVKVGGGSIDLAIAEYLRLRHGVLVGLKSAEKVKLEVAGLSEGWGKSTVIRGKAMETSLPRSLMVSSEELLEPLSGILSKLSRLVTQTLEQAPPELEETIIEGGLFLIGGGAKLSGLADMLSAESSLQTTLVEDCEIVALRGMERLWQDSEKLKIIKQLWRY